MSQRKPKNPKDTVYFHYYNANSHNHKVGDCVIRAISTILEQPWEVTYDGLVEIGRKYGRMPNDDNVINRYLTALGYEKQKEPRTADNKKIKISDYVKEHPHFTAIASLGTRHLAAVVDGIVYDIWDSSDEILHTFYVKQE